MKHLQIVYKERVQTEGIPGHQWVNQVREMRAPSIGAALLQIYYTGAVIQPGESVVLE